jgi:hypothetical protein
MSGSIFHGDFLLSGSRIDGVLVLAGAHPATWQGEDQVIDLSSATVQGIEDRPDSWPPNVYLAGFVLEKARGYGINQPSFIDRDGDWYVSWLKRDQFSPTSYAQVENLLRSAGRTSAANKVGMARVAGENEESGGVRRWMSPLSWVTVGYGYHPEWIIVWILAFIAIGAVVARKLPDTALESRYPAIISAHRLIPIISFGKVYEDVDLTGADVKRWIRWYFYLHAIVGFVLAAVLVAALTVITSTGLK